jgi:predicted phosphoribosyltransferase
VIVDDGVETNAKLHAAALATRCRARHGMDRIDP